MALPRRFRSFSLRTLLVLVSVCALAVWAWLYYQRAAELRLQAAVAAILAENPDSHVTYLRSGDDLMVSVFGIDRITEKTAQLVGQAEMIRSIRFEPFDATANKHDFHIDDAAVAALRSAFATTTVANDADFPSIHCERVGRSTAAYPIGKFRRWIKKGSDEPPYRPLAGADPTP